MRIWVWVLVAACLTPAPANTAEVIGHAAAIINQVNGQVGRTNRRLNTRDKVHFQELIRARAASTGQFQLLDGTRLVVGPGAAMRLDSFVYSDKSAKGVTLSTLKGAFRFISGAAKSSTYRVRTPVAIIGLRGTAFDFYVGRGGTTSVMLLRGAVQVCSTSRQCRTLRRPCEVVRVTRNSISPIYRGADRRAVRGVSMQTAFPFLFAQRQLLRSFRSRGLRACGSSTATPNPTPNPSVATLAAPAIAPSPRGGRFGNPGNDNAVGRAGEAPNGGNFGLGNVGRGDVGQGNNGNNGNNGAGPGLAGVGVGPGGNGPGGNGPGGNGPGGNGPGGNGPGGNGPGGNGPGGNGPGGNGPGGAGPGGPGGPGGAGGK